MTTTSPTPHQRQHDQHPPRGTRRIEPSDWADALNAQARTCTRLVYFCLGILAGALFCLGYLAGQNGARPSAYPYPVAASTPATPGGLGAGALGFTGPGDRRRCDTPTSRDSDGRESVALAGPVTVSIPGIDLARLGSLDVAAEPCGDHADTRPSSSHDNDSGNGSDHGSGEDSNKDKNRKDKNGNQRDRDGWVFPSDPRDWSGWRGDGLPPYNYGPGYGPSYGPGYGLGYGPGYGPGWGPGSGPGYGPYGYNYPPSGDRGNGAGRGEMGMCGVYRPGALRDLPDGGLVCTRANQPPR